MRPSNSPAAGLRSAQASSGRTSRKGNEHTELSRSQLERMLFDAAKARAANARGRSRA